MHSPRSALEHRRTHSSGRRQEGKKVGKRHPDFVSGSEFGLQGYRVQGLRVQSLGFKACRTKSSEVWDAAPKAATHIVPCRQGSTAQVISASILDGIIYMHIYIHTYIL